MKSTPIDSGVLTGQGAVGSQVAAGVPSQTPAQGPAAGGPISFPTADAGASAAAVAGATMPPLDRLSGPIEEPETQYDTIKPIPEG